MISKRGPTRRKSSSRHGGHSPDRAPDVGSAQFAWHPPIVAEQGSTPILGTGPVLLIWSLLIIGIGLILLVYGMVVVRRDRRRRRRLRVARQVVRAQLLE